MFKVLGDEAIYVNESGHLLLCNILLMYDTMVWPLIVSAFTRQSSAYSYTDLTIPLASHFLLQPLVPFCPLFETYLHVCTHKFTLLPLHNSHCTHNSSLPPPPPPPTHSYHLFPLLTYTHSRVQLLVKFPLLEPHPLPWARPPLPFPFPLRLNQLLAR